MIDLQQEYEHLRLADRHLVAGEKRVADQISASRIAARGQDTTSAERTLRLFQDALEQWQAHRHLILDAIARHSRPFSDFLVRHRTPSQPLKLLLFGF